MLRSILTILEFNGANNVWNDSQCTMDHQVTMSLDGKADHHFEWLHFDSFEPSYSQFRKFLASPFYHVYELHGIQGDIASNHLAIFEHSHIFYTNCWVVLHH